MLKQIKGKKPHQRSAKVYLGRQYAQILIVIDLQIAESMQQGGVLVQPIQHQGMLKNSKTMIKPQLYSELRLYSNSSVSDVITAYLHLVSGLITIGHSPNNMLGRNEQTTCHSI